MDGLSRASTPALVPSSFTSASVPPAMGSMGPPPQAVGPRQIDLLKEHRPYCPYVVKSTVVPSLPVPSSTEASGAGHGRGISGGSFGSAGSGSSVSLSGMGAGMGQGQGAYPMEGWKAVLTIVLRYRMEARRREGLIRAVDRKISQGANGANGVGVNGHGHGNGKTVAEGENGVEVNGNGTQRLGEPMDVDVDGDEQSAGNMQEDDPVEAMMNGVKSKGVRPLSCSCHFLLHFLVLRPMPVPVFLSLGRLLVIDCGYMTALTLTCPRFFFRLFDAIFTGEGSSQIRERVVELTSSAQRAPFHHLLPISPSDVPLFLYGSVIVRRSSISVSSWDF